MTTEMVARVFADIGTFSKLASVVETVTNIEWHLSEGK